MKADRLIIDELQGRRAAARRQIAVLGTVRVLDEAAARGWISLPDAVARLQETNFHLAPEFLEWLLTRDAERQRSG
jgi:predicted nucleic acid-binding protein